MVILGETIDDAAGEAFDKISKLLGLPYPGGPLLDKLAQKGNPKAFVFAKPQVPNLDYSFSGLKTSVLYFLQKQSPEFIQEHLNDLCASVQYTIVEILLKQLKKAIQETGIQEFCIAGGVSANSGLRNGVAALAQKTKSRVFLPAFEYCTDNAAMIAMAAHYKYLEGAFESLDVTASARSNW
jgi:N6-L-threonylcarbamoyladenine synthase